MSSSKGKKEHISKVNTKNVRLAVLKSKQSINYKRVNGQKQEHTSIESQFLTNGKAPCTGGR